MPTVDSTLGLLQLPLPAGAINTEIDDISVSGLLDYFAFWLRYDLNTKLANLQGTSADACPVTNRFPWNPLDPTKTFVRGRQDGDPSPFPALYLWLDGGKITQYTQVYDMRERTGGLLWLFDEIPIPGALVDRHGLRGAVEATIMRANSLARHPSYAFRGGPLGQPIDVALNLTGWGSQIVSSKQGIVTPIVTPSDPDNPVVHGYPSVQIELKVYEQIDLDQPVAGDLENDASVTSTLGSDPLNPTVYGKRYLG